MRCIGGLSPLCNTWHIPCTTGPHYAAACQMSEHHVSRDTGNMTRDTVTSSDLTWWHSPGNGREEHEASVTWTMRGINKDRAACCIISLCLYSYTQLLLIGCCTYSLLTQWVNGNWAIFGFGKVSLSSASLSPLHRLPPPYLVAHAKTI